MKSKYKGTKGFLKSFSFAWAGLRLLLFKERNITLQFLFGVAVLISGFFFQISETEWFMVIISIVTVLSFEIINSAIETLADAITEEENHKIKKAKDLAAGAVLLAAIGATAMGIMVFLPKVLELMGQLFY